jgi:hypothetical protein
MTSGRSLRFSTDETVITSARTPVAVTARRMTSALPISTGRDTLCTSPVHQALATTSGPIPLGSPITVPTKGLRSARKVVGARSMGSERIDDVARQHRGVVHRALAQESRLAAVEFDHILVLAHREEA